MTEACSNRFCLHAHHYQCVSRAPKISRFIFVYKSNPWCLRFLTSRISAHLQLTQRYHLLQLVSQNSAGTLWQLESIASTNRGMLKHLGHKKEVSKGEEEGMKSFNLSFP